MTSSSATIEQRLARYVTPAGELLGKDMTVERSRELAALVGDPQDELRVVHVAGTSGKTSTCYYITAMLRSGGKRVGLTVSPHIRSITERVQIDGRPLDDETFCRYMEEYLPLIESWEQRPSYFELMMVFALWVFAREGVDYAVVETGLGGLHDTSNICRREDKFCIITDIGRDHMHVLGNTVGEIAMQKAGIIAPRNIVLSYVQSDEIMQPIIAAAEESRATLELRQPPATPDFRERNFVLAQHAYALLARRDGLPTLSPEQLSRARQIEAPGRLAVMQRGDSQLIVDGAHNQQKMVALIATLQHEYPAQKFALVLAMKEGKEYREVIAELAPLVTRVVVTRFEQIQDAPIRSIDPGVLADEFPDDIDASIADSLETAVDQLVQAGEPHILVTGSLYAASELLQ